MAANIASFLDTYVSAELAIFIISLMPVLELRGGLIAAAILGVPWRIAAPICVIANIIPVPFILFLIEWVLGILKKYGPFKKLAIAIEKRGRRKSEELLRKNPTGVLLGLTLFVGIPLPMTGAWTGSLIAALLGIPPKKSLPAIFVGVCIACAIMLTLTYFIPGLFGF